MCLDARRQHQLTELGDQLADLRQLVASLQSQLEQINSTLLAKSSVSSSPAEEVYEEEYEYDDEENSYEYDDEEDEPRAKATVARTSVLSEPTSARQRLSEPTASRHRRDVPVREESGLETLVGSNGSVHGIKFHHKDVQQQHKPSSHSPHYQEQRRGGESVVRLRHRGRIPQLNFNDNDKLVTRNSPEEFASAENSVEHQIHLLAAHYVGDTTSYNSTSHVHYYGNNILYHPHGIFKDWVPSMWMVELNTYRHFPMYSNGKLSIQMPGIYLVYAQIYYVATHEKCGFHIKHNGDEVAQCMIMSAGRAVKRNTCYTSVTLHLHKQDLLWISEVEGFRNTSFKSSHSFFGLIQLRPT